MKVLKDGKVFVDGQLRHLDLGFEEEIHQIGSGLKGEEINCRGKIIIPALIDVHVHFRDFAESHKETIKSGSKAAIKGGIGTVIDMPNNQPPVTSVKMVEEKRKRAESTPINYLVYGGITGENLDDIPQLAGEVTAFKLYMGETTGRLVVTDHQLQKEIFKTVAKTGLILTVHTQSSRKKTSGSQEPTRRLELLERALDLATRYKNDLHLAHLSTKKEVKASIQAKKETNITAETCPHYLLLTEADLSDKGPFLKVNPPLAKEEDRGFLWEAIQDGLIDILASDHAPHTTREKSTNMKVAPAGLPGVETLLPIVFNQVNRNKISLKRLVELCSYYPACRFKIKKRGEIAPGYHADLVVIDPKHPRTVKRDDLVTKCGWSPYEGREFVGWPEMTFLSGQKAYPRD